LDLALTNYYLRFGTVLHKPMPERLEEEQEQKDREKIVDG